MKVSFENPDKVNGFMTIVVEENDYKDNVEKALKDYRKKANIPGFRPGNAPMGMIKKQYGEYLKLDAINKIVGEELYKYIQDNKIAMLGEPLPSAKQEPQDLEKEPPYTFYFDIAIAPEFKVALSGKDKIAYYDINVDDATIDKQVDIFASRTGQYTKAESYQKNDMLKGDLRELDEQGNTKEADELFLLYKKEERRFFYYLIGWEKLISWKKAEKNSDEMYQNKKYYDEYRKDKKLNRFSVFLKLISSWTNNIIWGYGIKIHRIVTSMILGILIFSFIYFSITDINYLDSIFLSFKTWMLNNEYESNNKVVSAFMILENLLGLVSLALFTSAFYRKVEK